MGAHHMLGQGIQKHVGRLDVVVDHLCVRTCKACEHGCNVMQCILCTSRCKESPLKLHISEHFALQSEAGTYTKCRNMLPGKLQWLLRTRRLCRNASPRATSNRIFNPMPCQPNLSHA